MSKSHATPNEVLSPSAALTRGKFGSSSERWMKLALVVSIGFHLGLLTVKFGIPKAAQFFAPNTPLEVVIVNSSTSDIPVKPEVLAQSNIDGGGIQGPSYTSTPLPAEDMNTAGVIAQTAQADEQKIAALEHQQEVMRAELKALDSLPLPQPEAAQGLTDEERQRVEEISQQLNQLEGAIEERTQAYSQRPKVKQITSISAKKAVFAQYYDLIRRKVEDFGSVNFPEQHGQRLYGRLIVVMNINAKGQLGFNRGGQIINGVELAQSSGNPVLDQKALEIVKAAAPFPPFDQKLAKTYDVLEVISTFTFGRDGSVDVTTRTNE